MKLDLWEKAALWVSGAGAILCKFSGFANHCSAHSLAQTTTFTTELLVAESIRRLS